VSNPPQIRLTPQEQVVAKARSTAYGLGARLILDPSDPGVHQDLRDYLSGEGAQAMEAMRELETMTADQVEERLRQFTTRRRVLDDAAAPWQENRTAAPTTHLGAADEARDEPGPLEPETPEDEPEPANVDDAPAALEPDDPTTGDDDAWLREYDKLAALAEGKE